MTSEDGGIQMPPIVGRITTGECSARRVLVIAIGLVVPATDTLVTVVQYHRDDIVHQGPRLGLVDQGQFRAIGLTGIAAVPLVRFSGIRMNAVYNDLLATTKELHLLVGVAVRCGQQDLYFRERCIGTERDRDLRATPI